MIPIHSILILFAFGVVAGFININAGGGSILTLPVLIFLGLNSAVANGTNRVGVFLQTATGVYSFKKEDYHQFRLSMKMSLLTLPGAIAGAFLSIRIGDETFQKILGVIMIGIIISMIIPKSKKSNVLVEDSKITWKIVIAMALIGFYGGFIQVGVGFLIMAALNYIMRLNLVHVNMHKVFIVAVYTLPALLIFILQGDVNWSYGLSLAAGTSLGAFWAAKFSVRGGEKWIKVVLIIAVILMSLKLWNIL